MTEMLNVLRGVTVIVEKAYKGRIQRIDINENVAKSYCAYVYLNNGITLRVFTSGNVEIVE